LWDVFTGWHGWSVDYVIPIAFASVMTATAILARILKMPTETYMVYSVLLILYGIIPAIFVLSGLSTIIYPSLICVAGSLLSLAALLIFESRNMIEELKRRLHL
jgi:MFS superfamily sulfate permease-like transporter